MSRAKPAKLFWSGLAVALLLSVLIVLGCAGPQPTPTPTPTPPLVEIVIYSDFQCHACADYLDVELELKSLYVDTGKAEMDMRDLPALSPQSASERAAEAALCAAEQGQYWEYREAIITAWLQAGRDPDAYSEEELCQTASELGLNEEAFSTCLSSGAMQAKVNENWQLAQRDGINAVPTVFINGVKVEGIPSLETLGNLIDELLAE